MKEFNDTGLCIPEKHYMADVSGKIQAIFSLLDRGKYFVINRPRQYGKTTTLYLLERKLQTKPNYLPIFISFEGLGAEAYQDEHSFIEALFSLFRPVFKRNGQDDLLQLLAEGQGVTAIHRLNAWISELVTRAGKRVVLMVDEVDKSSDNQRFLDFLALLRTKYLFAAQGKEATFHSVILAGVHDVKSLKLKVRSSEKVQYNSPWNIAVDFKVEMSLSPAEIETMLAEYAAETGVVMPQPVLAQRLYDYTSGHPFLVSKLCKVIDEDLMHTPLWQPDFVEEAVSRILQLNHPNFESLIKNLENHPDLYELVKKIVLFGEIVSYNRYNPIINLGFLYGIFVQRNNFVDIHNRIYKEQIYNYMTIKLELDSLIRVHLRDYNLHQDFTLPDNSLNVELILLKFQEFMRQEYSQRDRPFLERNGRLIFLAFIKPIINGRGYDFKEVQISEEKRLDVVIVFDQRKYIVELKLWRGEQAHQKGLQQLHDYLDWTGLDTGYLIIFDFTQKKKQLAAQARLQVESKEIFVVWV